jgi:hypothetical protein
MLINPIKITVFFRKPPLYRVAFIMALKRKGTKFKKQTSDILKMGYANKIREALKNCKGTLSDDIIEAQVSKKAMILDVFYPML